MALAPEVTAGIRSANEELLDRIILHSVFLQRMKTGEIQKLVKFLDRDVFPDLTEIYLTRLARIEANQGIDPGTWTTRRYRDMMAQADAVINEGIAEVHSRTRDMLFQTAKHESRFLVGAIQSSIPLHIDLRLANLNLIRSAIVSRPFQGKLLSEWFQGLTAGVKQRVNTQFKIGMVEGETIQQLVRRIRGKGGVFDQTRRGVEAITRTAVNHTTTHARMQTAQDNLSVIKALLWISTLDTKTTPICRARDGKRYPPDSKIRPPAHIGCRSDFSFVLKDWKELGIDLEEAPPGLRESMNGYVPETKTYGPWLRENLDRPFTDPRTGETKSIGDWVLGPKKKELFRRGHLTIDRFVDDAGRALTFPELEALEADVLKKAGKLPVTAKPTPKAISLLRGHEARAKIQAEIGRIDAELERLAIRRAEVGLEWTEKEKARLDAIRRGADPSTLPSTGKLTLEFDRITERKIELVRNRAKVVQDVLRVEDPLKINMDIGPSQVKGRGSARIRSEAARGVDFLQSILSRNVFGTSGINIQFRRLPARERGFYLDVINAIHLSSKHGAQTYVHEMGHALENRFRMMRERASKFLQARAAEDADGLQSLKKLFPKSRYGADEKTWKDRFIRAYMGKYYSDGSTEIVSMGLEYLFANPFKLMNQDPEYFDFIVDLIHGFYF